MMYPKHLGDVVKSVMAAVPTRKAATDAGNEVAINGSAIDRQDFYSAVLAAPVAASLSEGNTFTVSVKLQESADGSTGWTDIEGAASGDVVLTGGVGGSTESQLIEIDVDLSGVKRYVRAVIAGSLSGLAASGDEAVVSAALVLGGAVEKPV